MTETNSRETGKPLVGPAGRLLDRALEEAGIDRSRTYVTAAQALLRGVPGETPLAALGFATIHPSAVLRRTTAKQRSEAWWTTSARWQPT